jgi:parallel beta-helix repeat protein
MPARARSLSVPWPQSTILLIIVSLMMTLGDDPALAGHVNCGEIITEDTRLDTDLVNCPEHGIVIGADNTTLDLGGHTIAGDPEGFFDIGIDNSAGYDGVSIRNGTVKEFDTGVALVGTIDNHIEALVVSTAHFGNGILVDGFAWGGSSSNRIEKSTLTGNGGAGIDLTGTFDNVVSKNTITGNGEGLRLFASHNNLFNKNLVSRNRSQGFSLFESDGNRMTKNAVTENGLHGYLIVDDADENLVEKNVVSGNAVGILIADSKRRPGAKHNIVTRNDVDGNTHDGIALQGPSHEPPFPPAPGATETLIERNDANGNGDDGIDVRAPSTTIRKNTANNNADLGIEAVPGVTDGGGNRAKGNGNPLQCVNVACNSSKS